MVYFKHLSMRDTSKPLTHLSTQAITNSHTHVQLIHLLTHPLTNPPRTHKPTRYLPPIHSPTHLFTNERTRILTNSFIHPLTRPHTHSLAQTPVHPLIYSSTDSPTASPIHSYTHHSPTPSPTHSLKNQLHTNPLTNPITHPITTTLQLSTSTRGRTGHWDTWTMPGVSV